jgi:glucokinase
MSWEAVGLDVGGTKIEAARVRAGRVETDVRLATPSGESTEVLEAIANAASQVLREGLPVGVAVAGQVAEGGTVLGSPNLPLAGVALGPELARRLGTRVVVDNDVRLAALGQWELLDPRPRVLAVMSIGTGIGTAVVKDGQAERGAHGLAGEGGHVTAVPDGEMCACGRRGCVEAYAGGRSLVRRYLAMGGDPACSGAADVIRRAREGDRKAVWVWRDAVTALEVLLQSLVILFDPDVVAVGGGVASATPEVLHLLSHHLERAAWGSVPRPALVEMHPGAALIGAARSAINRLGDHTP